MPKISFGWVPNPAATEAFCATIPRETNEAANALQEYIRDRQDVKLWTPLAKVLGRDPLTYRLPARNQKTKGSCVGVSDAGLQDVTAACDIIERGDNEEWRGFHSGVAAYIAGRQIGNMLGGGDGSYGSAMARAVREIGTLIRGTYGGFDLTDYSIDAIETLDRRGGGLTPAMMEVAREHPIELTVNVETLERLDGLLYQFIGTNICSDFGSNDRERNADGCLRWNGKWPHSMHVVGIVWKNGKKIYIVRNSWGSKWMTRGPLVCPNMPLGSFGVYAEDMARILKQGDSFARAGYRGFRRREIDLAAVFDF